MTPAKKVVLVVTSCDRLGDSGKATGYWLEELALPYFALRDDGADVVIASPKGGIAPADPRSIERASSAAQAGEAAWFERWESDLDAKRRAAETVTTASLEFTDFDAAFVAGGHGAMWDLSADSALGTFIHQLLAADKVVGTVCHGAAALCAVTDESGAPGVAQRKITCYSDEEEQGLGLAEIVPFLLETKMRELGAQVVVGPPRASFTMQDSNLITGQNPASSSATAALFVAALHN